LDESSLAIDQIATDGWLPLVSMLWRSIATAAGVMSSMYRLLCAYTGISDQISSPSRSASSWMYGCIG
jgi:hypothetical protein